MRTFIHLFSYPHFSRRYREDIEKIAPQKTANFFRKKKPKITPNARLQDYTITLIYESIGTGYTLALSDMVVPSGGGVFFVVPSRAPTSFVKLTRPPRSYGRMMPDILQLARIF